MLDDSSIVSATMYLKDTREVVREWTEFISFQNILILFRLNICMFTEIMFSRVCPSLHLFICLFGFSHSIPFISDSCSVSQSVSLEYEIPVEEYTSELQIKNISTCHLLHGCLKKFLFLVHWLIPRAANGPLILI